MRIYFINIYNSIRKQRIQNSLELKLIKSHRNSIWKHLSNNKCEKSIKYLGCDIKQLKSWLIFQFDECMTMDNYGSYWSLDHILPLSLFDLTKIENQKIAFNWKNMQPHTENSSKSNKLYLFEYFNAFISAHRFIKLYKLNSMEYQGLNESLTWLKIYLTGNNLQDNTMDNPQPSSYEDK